MGLNAQYFTQFRLADSVRARAIQKGEIIMQTFKTTILVASLVALVGCASSGKSSVATYDHSPVCTQTHGWQPWSDDRCNPPEAPRDLAAELAAAQNEIQSLGLRLSTVKGLLADREKEIAALRVERDRK